MVYRIKNWREFQHYKDRNPPWIKLHFSILSSKDWVTLDDASRVLAITLMLIGSKNEGLIDGSDSGLEYIRRVAYLKKRPNIKPLILCGFLEIASECKQMLAEFRPETENINTDREEVPAEVSGERTALPSSANGKHELDENLKRILQDCPHLSLVSTGASSEFWDQVLATCEPYQMANAAWLNAKIRQWNQWFEGNPGRRSRDRKRLESRLLGWLTRDLERLARSKT